MDEELLRIITEEVLAALAARGISVRKGTGGCASVNSSPEGSAGRNRDIPAEIPKEDGRAVCGERLITGAVADALCKGGVREVCILNNALVTPSAWDVFKEKKVNVSRNG